MPNVFWSSIGRTQKTVVVGNVASFEEASTAREEAIQAALAHAGETRDSLFGIDASHDEESNLWTIILHTD